MNNNFKLTGPFADDLMNEAEARVLTRGYTSEELSDTAIPEEYDLISDPYMYCNKMLEYLSQLNNINTFGGKGLKPFIKRFLFKIFAWHVIPTNQTLVMAIEHMHEELNHINEQIEDIKKKIKKKG